MSEFYNAPWSERYSSESMLANFSNDNKYITWRRLWIALAESQMELGLSITPKQIQDLKDNLTNIDYKNIKKYEQELHHDVMSHIKAYGDVAPSAKGIIHLGATSAFVTDNTDLIQIKKGLEIIRIGLVQTIDALSILALKYKDIPTLGFTHFQAAQLTTVGKRATLWIQSFVMDLQDLDYIYDNLTLRGIKGAVGTGSGFFDLFDGNYEKFKQLDSLIVKKLGFTKSIPVSGQTYDRKIDSKIADLLNQIAQSAHKFTNDIRLLQSLKEMEEIFEDKQIGSSAMAYKRNPILSERISSLSKFIISLSSSPSLVASTQWFERTLDDSANKRVTMPQLFLATDAVLILCEKISSRLTIYPKIIEKHINEELPFIATEALLMKAVKKGGDRQELHEIIRGHSMKSSDKVKYEALDNDLITRLSTDDKFPLTLEEITETLNANNFTGYATKQTVDFLTNIVAPILIKYQSLIKKIS
ncbi:MAG: adenylosuccinate lyase [Spirochaetota bacterium]|nr:adenylosuccinate lyase [Spirochaetota bacterium]